VPAQKEEHEQREQVFPAEADIYIEFFHSFHKPSPVDRNPGAAETARRLTYTSGYL
jgi:hypothetical protein